MNSLASAIEDKQLIKPVYEQNPRPYTDTARSGHKEQPTDPG